MSIIFTISFSSSFRCLMSAITFSSSSSSTLMFLPLELPSLDEILALFRSVDVKLRSDKLDPAECVVPADGKSRWMFVSGGPRVGFPSCPAGVILDEEMIFVVNICVVVIVCPCVVFIKICLLCGLSCPIPDAVVMVIAAWAMVT